MNKEELTEYQRKQKHASYMRQYYETHPEAREKKREADRIYAAKNKEKALTRAQEYYRVNTEKRKTYSLQRAYLAKKKAVDVLGGKCKECGFSHPAALQFHHRDPQTKSFSITSKQLTTPKRFPWEMILEEIEKCDLLCANCHAVHHSKWAIE